MYQSFSQLKVICQLKVLGLNFAVTPSEVSTGETLGCRGVQYFSILLLRLAETLGYFFLDLIFSGDALVSVTCTKPSTVSPGDVSEMLVLVTVNEGRSQWPLQAALR